MKMGTPSKASSHETILSDEDLLPFAGGALLIQMAGPISILQELTGLTKFHRPLISPSSDYTKDSLQKRILTVDGDSKAINQKWKRLEQARDKAFLIVMKLLIGKAASQVVRQLTTDFNWEAIQALHEVSFWRAISIIKAKSLQLPMIKRRITIELEKCNAAFFIKLGTELDRRNKSAKTLEFNSIIFTMAQFWVSPDFPLWMMNNEAGSRFVGYTLGIDVSAENYAQLIKRHRLPRYGKFPIRGITTGRNGEFRCFEFSRWAESIV